MNDPPTDKPVQTVRVNFKLSGPFAALVLLGVLALAVVGLISLFK